MATLHTLLIATLGLAAFWVLNLPLPFLLGPMFACLIAALAGVKLRSMGLVGKTMRTILGVAVGTSLTPSIVGRLPEFALSAVLIVTITAAILALGYPYFRRGCGFDKATAWYAAAPGGLQDMIIFGQEAGGDARALSLIHATRVLIIVSLIPFLLSQIWSVPLNNPPGVPASSLPWQEMLLMAACGLVGWKLGEAVGLFGAGILGPLILAGALTLGDVIHSRPPAEAIQMAQFFIGITVGSYYTGITSAEIKRFVVSGIGYCAIIGVLSAIFASLAHWLGAAPWIEAILAFAPGGQGELVVLAIVVGADLSYVVAMHLVRLFTVILGAPLIARWLP